jgi:hypothetical protein
VIGGCHLPHSRYLGTLGAIYEVQVLVALWSLMTE